MTKEDDFECPHCGSKTSLTERTEKDFKPIIPEDLQYDWRKDISSVDNVYIPPTPKELYSDKPRPPPLHQNNVVSKRVSQDIPLESIFRTVDDPSVKLDPASQKVYFQLSIEFQIILDKAPNYREGVHRWNLILDDRLQAYGLTRDAWERISKIGDSDSKIQAQLSEILRRIFD
ncbi:MAG: hypothetical protein ACFFAJ_04905 [Candidatus Hodarchaeota archaeon]